VPGLSGDKAMTERESVEGSVRVIALLLGISTVAEGDERWIARPRFSS
jgi:hypothetical protein